MQHSGEGFARVRFLAAALGVPVGFEVDRASEAVGDQGAELADEVHLAAAHTLPGDQAGRGIDDARILDVDVGGPRTGNLVAGRKGVAAGHEAVGRIQFSLTLG